MQAAVLHRLGESPRYENFPDPVIETESQLLVTVKAASIKNIDKMRAGGTHYDSYEHLPVVPGVDGVGILKDGTRVYAGGHTGMMAEQAIISNRICIPLPGNIDDITAAALPNPGLSAWFSLSYRAAIQPGDTVFINGATGVTGKLAIQLAKQLGADKVIAAGRNEEILQTLPALGADALVSLSQDDTGITQSIKKELAQAHFDIVIDYLWGHPATLLLNALTGHDLAASTQRTRYISVGEMAGPTIELASASLRSSAIELYGVGGGSVPKEVMQKVPTEILPRLFELAATGQLKIDTEAVPLQEVESVWNRDSNGKRLVLVP